MDRIAGASRGGESKFEPDAGAGGRTGTKSRRSLRHGGSRRSTAEEGTPPQQQQQREEVSGEDGMESMATEGDDFEPTRSGGSASQEAW